MRIPRFARVLIALCVGFFLVQLHACSNSKGTQADGINDPDDRYSQQRRHGCDAEAIQPV